MNNYRKVFILRNILILVFLLNVSCHRSSVEVEEASSEEKPETLVRRRDDGTISSVNQMDEDGRIHGIRATYYGDGKTLYAKQTFSHGRKQGPASWYYKNGRVFKQTSFAAGKRQGLSRIYYKSGKLLAEYESDKGHVLPGLKEYLEDGTLVTSYPDVQFREIDFLESNNRLDLQVYCTKKRSGVKFYILHEKEGETSRVYLITKNDSTLLQYYVQPGQTLERTVDILAEIPTELGNIRAEKYSYQLRATN